MATNFDMSLDDIIKLNKKKVKEEKKAQATTSGQQRGQTPRKPRTKQTPRKKAAQSAVSPKLRIPNKLRKFSPQSPRLPRTKGNAQQKRKLTTKRSQKVVSRARQTLRESLRTNRRQRKEQIVNRYRGLSTTPSTTPTASVQPRRRNATRTGLGVMHADVVAQELRVKQANAFKYAQEAALTGQNKQNVKRRLKRQQERAQATAAGVTSRQTIQKRQRRLKKAIDSQPTTPTHTLTVQVKNDLLTTSNYRGAEGLRSHSAANRMLQNTLQQPLRERSHVRRQSRQQEQDRDSGVSGQVRMLNATIQKLQEEVSLLRTSGAIQGQRKRNNRSQTRKQKHTLRDNSRYSQSQPAYNPTRRVRW